ncbi:MAG: tripartite tricarboxylate transporter substrate binding protein [Pseudolabrys sp.]
MSKAIDMHRRAWLAGAAAFSGTTLIAGPAMAQNYPARPVRIIVPYPPGGGTDVFARLLAAKIEAEFGQALYVDNRTGGASVVGTRTVAEATPDGYTIGMVDSAFTINPSLLKELPYDTRKSFTPVSLLSRTQLILCVPEASPFKTTQDLVAHAKANPGKLTFASAGNGSPPHLAGEQFRQAAAIEMVTVPYRGGAPALTGLLSGAVDFTVSTVPTIQSQIQAGKARGLAVTRGRTPLLPDIPGMDELGYASVDATSDMGLVVAAGTPAPIVEKLQRLSAAAVKEPAFRDTLIQRGFQPIGSTSEEFRVYIEGEIEKWAKVIAAGNIKPD